MQSKGFWSAAAAYTLWGFFPAYWKLLGHVPASQNLAHRMVWSLVFLLLVQLLLRRWRQFVAAIRSWRTVATLTSAALLLGFNWYVYIWGVNNGFVIETSLGYFINPLVNVLLGMLFFRERLRRGQQIAIGLAAAGVLFLTWQVGTVPWIALSLAVSFGFYGLLKKQTSLQALDGLTLETLVLMPPALLYLFSVQQAGSGAFGTIDLATNLILISTGVVTAIPLLFFAYGAQRVQLSTLGLLQYIAPTIQFLLGLLVYGEPFTREQAFGYAIIWCALLVYSAENLWQRRRRLQPAGSLPTA